MKVAFTTKYLMTTLIPGRSDYFSSNSIKVSFTRVKDYEKR